MVAGNASMDREQGMSQHIEVEIDNDDNAWIDVGHYCQYDNPGLSMSLDDLRRLRKAIKQAIKAHEAKQADSEA